MILTMLYGGIVGIALGLTGGGGSIFAVPLLLYAIGLPLREAVTVSLGVVGLTALYGAGFQRSLVSWLPGIIFGIGGILGAPAGAWIGARLPQFWTLVLFAGLMVFIGVRMWRDRKTKPEVSRFTCRRDTDGVLRLRWPCSAKLLFAGGTTGVLSGTFGVGGGFLVVPALLLVTAMPIERALATSLVCIALISASAFFSNFLAIHNFPYVLAAWFLVGGALGMTLGASVKAYLSGPMLKRIFAVSIIGIGFWIGTQTLFGKSLKAHFRKERTSRLSYSFTIGIRTSLTNPTHSTICNPLITLF
jgi:uncharacterized protein